CPPLAPHSFPTRRSSDLYATINNSRYSSRVARRPSLTARVCLPVARSVSTSRRLLTTRIAVTSVATGIAVTIDQGNSAPVCRYRSEEHTSELQSQSNLVC